MTQSSLSVLITGANGFVGSRLCRHLQERGYRVVAGVRRSSDLSQLEGLDVEYRYGDVTQPGTLGDMVAGVDIVVHNAGLVKARSRGSFFACNAEGTKALFEAIVAVNPALTKAVYISSLAAAGPSTGGRLLRESDPPRPITEYGESKLAGERYALSYAGRVHAVAVRPPGVYGPGDREAFELFRTVHMRLLPYIGDVTRRLNMVYIDDLCRGIEAVIAGPTWPGEIYYIAEREAHAMRELVRSLQRGCGRKGLPLVIPAGLFRLLAASFESVVRLVGATPMLTREKANELLASWEVDTTLAKERLGFESSVAFDEGARRTYEWYYQKGWL